MNDKQKALALLDKYIKVLKTIEGHPQGVVEVGAGGYEKCYKCSCPNHAMHNSGSKNHKMKIGVVKSHNPKKFGEYMVTYCCWAYRDHGCKNDVLANIFKEYGLTSDTRFFYPRPHPIMFPKNDTTWKAVKNMERHNTGAWAYTDISGATKFIRYRFDRPDGSKGFVNISFSPAYVGNEFTSIDGSGGFTSEMLWEAPWDPYKVHQLAKIWQKENNKEPYEVAIINEGEGKADVNEKHFPNYFSTTFNNAKTSWKQSELRWFERFKRVIVVPDHDKGSYDSFKRLTFHLRDMNIDARLVELPSDLPLAWDIKDGFEKGSAKKYTLDDYKEWLETAAIPLRRKENKEGKPIDYSNIGEDAQQKRWDHLEEDKLYHYDRWNRKPVHNHNINLWYKNDTTTRDSRNRIVPVATNYLHEIGCNVVTGLAYRPIDQEYIYEGNKVYVNSYVPYKPKEISAADFDEKRIEPFKLQIDIFSNFNKEEYNFFFDKLAYSIQYPENNIKFATLIVSDGFGAGKSYVWQTLVKLYGGLDYVAWIRSNDIFMQFKPWMANRSLVIVDEVKIEGDKKNKLKMIDELKGIISEKYHMVEPKGVNPYQVNNQYTVFMSTNHDSLGFIRDHDERRYFVMNCLMTRHEIRKRYPNHFENLIKLSENDEDILHLRYFLKHEWKISDYFLNEGFYEPLKTTAMHNMAQQNQPQLYNEFDELLFDKKPPFKSDVVNTREIYEFFRNLEDPKGTFKDVDEEIIRGYLKRRGRILNKGNAIEGMRSKGERARGWYAIRNVDYWLDQKPIQWRSHLRGELVAPLFREKQEEMFNDTEVSNNTTLN